MIQNGIQIYYYLNNERYAYRANQRVVPRKGDEIRFNGKIYHVVLVVWIEDQGKDNHVAISIVEGESA